MLGVSSNLTFGATQFIQQILIPSVIDYFQKLLQVVPFPKKLVLPANQCYAATIPEKYMDEGVDADLVLFITTMPTPGPVLAWAIACLFEMDSGR